MVLLLLLWLLLSCKGQRVREHIHIKAFSLRFGFDDVRIPLHREPGTELAPRFLFVCGNLKLIISVIGANRMII